jgi:hypothetical protein
LGLVGGGDGWRGSWNWKLLALWMTSLLFFILKPEKVKEVTPVQLL